MHENEIEKIEEWVFNQNDWWEGISSPLQILCHGAFRGSETDRFKFYGKVIGTDLAPEHPDVIEHDFRIQKEEWIGQFDLIYSNSLDHADDPESCIQVWLDQLTPDGLMFIQWTPAHIEVNGGDCFGAHLHEYVILFNRHGEVLDVLYCGDNVFLVVVGKKK